jgi:phosphoribosylamine--glycine ligase
VLDPEAVRDLAVANSVDLAVVGPEAPLDAGVADALVAAGVPTCGPQRRGAQLEASKAFAKEIMARAGVPTADARTFTDHSEAAALLGSMEPPYVVKADGLAAGKGVLVTEDLIAAQSWAKLCIDGHFGDAGRTVVVERYLDGKEVSVFALCDGTDAVALAPARDYKRLLEDDRGPNTGGMGCYSPPHDLPIDLVDETMNSVIRPVLDTLSRDGISYRGFLYAGLILTEEGTRVLEFNCRLGDPETQVLLPLLDEDLVELTAAAATGDLGSSPLQWRRGAAVDVVLAAGGYPEKPERGALIRGVADAAAGDGVHVFHAGTRQTPDGLAVAGGRVLNVVGTGIDVPTARTRAYDAVDKITFDGMHYRTDIAQ